MRVVEEPLGASPDFAEGPGPLRFRIRHAEIFRNPELARHIEHELGGWRGVARVRASELTGRILVECDRTCTKGSIECAVTGLVAKASIQRSIPRQHVPLRPAPRTVSAGTRQPDRRRSRQGNARWQALDSQAVLERLGSCGSGLSQSEAQQRLADFGKNALPEPEPPHAAALFAGQFKSLPVALLMGSAVLSLATGGLADAAITTTVVLANALIGYSTESAAQRSIAAMTKRASWPVRVRRDSRALNVSSEEIVPGDILLLQAGSILPADARIIFADDLWMNEALLTGESEPAQKQVAPVAAGAPLSAQASMAWRGTFVASGSGAAAVVSTGADTEIGRIESIVSGVRPPPTTLEKDLAHLGTQLAIISTVVCAGMFGLGILSRRPLAVMLKSSVALAVAAVPESLPAIATTTFAAELRRLRRKNVRVRHLHAVEGLGALSVICFDKTGTLTENDMSVTAVGLADGVIHIGRDYEPDRYTGNGDLRRLLEIGVLCSDVEVSYGETEPRLIGSSTERALVNLAMRHGIDVHELRRRKDRLDARLRSAERRLMATLHKRRTEEGYQAAVKGDPFVVIDRCSAALMNGQIVPLDDALRGTIRQTIEAMASDGARVLGFAFTHTATADGWFDNSLTWVGAVGLQDPIRPGTREVIEELHAAGIRTIMITGDHSATARAIATALDLSRGEALRILDATELSPERLGEQIRTSDVFARVSPTQKLDIVRALQAQGEVVGMTGDGFNDAPAMKAADIAIAIGIDSAGAARDVADVVIAGDHIRHIADGIAHGRAVQANVRKAVHFMLATNLSEILVILAETINRRDEIESPLEILWLNLITDILPGFGLALEPPEKNVMKGRPRTANGRFIDRANLRHSLYEALVIATCTMGAHGLGLSRYGPGPRTRSLTLFSLIAAQLLHGFTCRADRFDDRGGRDMFSNDALNASIGAAFGLQALPLFFPAMRRLLGIGPMSALDLAAAGAAGLASFGVIEGRRLLRAGRQDAE